MSGLDWLRERLAEPFYTGADGQPNAGCDLGSGADDVLETLAELSPDEQAALIESWPSWVLFKRPGFGPAMTEYVASYKPPEAT